MKTEKEKQEFKRQETKRIQALVIASIIGDNLRDDINHHVLEQYMKNI